MFCPKCGANLSQNSKKCPLCLTLLPKLDEKEHTPFYPDTPRPREKEDFRAPIFLVTLFFLIAGSVILALDLIENGGIGFSFYVAAPLLILYTSFVLPRWWRRPNPVVFLPITFCSLMVCFLYLDLRTHGGWFLSFAFPVLGGFFLFLEAAVTLLHYLRSGRLYIFGGLFLSMGILSFVGEILYRVTFSLPIRLTYSILFLIFFSLLGLGLITIAIVPPFRRYFERRFFV